MKRTILFLLLVAAAVTVAAAEPAPLKIRLDAADLQDGATYDFEVRAYYVFIDPKEKKRFENAGLEKSIRAPQVFRGRFTAPLAGREVPASIAFRFPATPPAPRGMMPALMFRTKVTITPPASTGKPSIESDKIYAGPFTAAERCLRLRGPISGRFYYVGVADCNDEMMALPKPAR